MTVTISNSYHLQCQGARNCQSQMSVTCWLFVDIHGSIAFPILPIDIDNPSRLSKRTLSIISISQPLKLSMLKHGHIVYIDGRHPQCLEIKMYIWLKNYYHSPVPRKCPLDPCSIELIALNSSQWWRLSGRSWSSLQQAGRLTGSVETAPALVPTPRYEHDLW